MSSSRIAAAIASLPQTRFDGALGTGRSISLPAAAPAFAGKIHVSSRASLARDYAVFREATRALPVTRRGGMYDAPRT